MMHATAISSIQPLAGSAYGRVVATAATTTVAATAVTEPFSRTERTTARPVERTPAVDTVDLTRFFPELLVGQLYPTQPPAGELRPFTAGDLTDDRADDPGTGSAADGTGETERDADTETNAAPGDPTDGQGEPLSDAEQREVAELTRRDREVRQHEQAHKAVGGQYAGAIAYEFSQGPDGKRYAVGGEVSIDIAEEGDPAATIAKMRQVRAAALAPANPSGQDRSVAAEAARIEAAARREALAVAAEETAPATASVDQAAAAGLTDEATDEPVPVATGSDAQRSPAPVARLSAAAGAAMYTLAAVAGNGAYSSLDVFA
ncbi:MAG: hypothetical protein LIP77_12400 [Planctomycetes bacterium]|nr:hypothetical protein [Planctomycetota bacterium]